MEKNNEQTIQESSITIALSRIAKLTIGTLATEYERALFLAMDMAS